ncbi:MAG: patatin-like phospholipase family protein [Acidobacteria bacterium]|nr:patatin-like phospholipase family protein [Acidobacteriota bacterium]
MDEGKKSLTAAQFLEDERRHWNPTKPFGLAISGGGIRSATFSLGVLQCLAAAGLLEKLDYLATVSGGGYIGTWLSTWAKRGGKVSEINDKLKPRPHHSAEEAPEIGWLRKYGNYLSPKVGLLSADTWAMLTIWAGNTMLTMLTLTALLLASLLIPWMVWTGIQWPQEAAHKEAIWLAAMIFLTLAPVYYLLGKDGQLRGWVPAGLVCLSSLLTAAAYWPKAVPDKGLDYLWPGSLGFGALTGGICVWGMLKSGEKDRWSGLRVGLRALLGVIVGSAGLWGLHQVARVSLSDGWLLQAALGPPLIALGLCAILSLMIGVIGWRMPDYDREGWRRVAAYICILLLASVALSLIAYFGPVLMGLLWKVTAVGLSTGGVWAAISGLGAWLGRSGSTSGRADSKRPIVDLLLPATGVVFTLGLMVILSVGAIDLLHLFTGAKNSYLASVTGPQQTVWCDACRREAAATDWGGVWDALQLAYQSDLKALPKSERPWAIGWAPFSLFALFCLFSRLFSINEFSLHCFYRNRLVRAYCGAATNDREKSPYSKFTNFTREDDPPMSELNPNEVGYLHLICCAANVNLEETGFAERRAAPFVFTPFGCGYALPDGGSNRDGDGQAKAPPPPENEPSGHAGYQIYPNSKDLKKVTAGTAMSISGAAASPNMGFHTSPIMAFLLSVFNVRLGYWMWNTGSHNSLTRSLNLDRLLPKLTKHNVTWEPRGPRNGAFYYLAELFGLANQRRKYIYLSDGGHFENLGVYELLRRRVKYIICIDAEADPDFQFESLGGLVRKARSDMGIEIDLDTSDIDPVKDGPPEGWWSRSHATVGKITYPQVKGKQKMGDQENEPEPAKESGKQNDKKLRENEGRLLYLKLSVTGDEPQDILTYRKQNLDFPHQSTGDQFFAESQFESYRRLGLHVARTTLQANSHDADRLGSHADIQPVADLEECFSNLRSGWIPTPRAISQNFTKHSGQLTEMLGELQTRPELWKLGRQLTPNIPGNVPEAIADGREYQESFFFCQRLLQLMEDVYLDLQLETNFDHLSCQGWMEQFREWAASEMMMRVYGATRQTFGAPFQSFYVRRLEKSKKPKK